MTILIDLQARPNQTVTATLDSDRYEITVKAANNIMAVDITRNNIRLMRGARVVAGTPLLPYRYQERGNFIFTTNDNQLPFYTSFGITHQLVYLTLAEVEASRNG